MPRKHPAREVAAVSAPVRSLMAHRYGLDVEFHGIPTAIFECLPGAKRSLAGGIAYKAVRVRRKRLVFFEDANAVASLLRPEREGAATDRADQ